MNDPSPGPDGEVEVGEEEKVDRTCKKKVLSKFDSDFGAKLNMFVKAAPSKLTTTDELNSSFESLAVETSSTEKLTSEKCKEMAETRRRVVGEIYSTEESYVNSLTAVKTKWYEPLKKSGILSERKLTTLFRNVADILSLNEKFQHDLKDVIAKDPQCVGAIFKQYAPFLRLYKQYTTEHEAASTLLTKLLTNDKYTKFQDFHQKALQESGMMLSSFMIMPIQRIPRYKLLLAEVVKNTMPDHEEIKTLHEAHDDIMKVALEINEDIREFERREKLLELQSRLDGAKELVQPHRLFVREGVLTKVCRKEDKDFVFFLFNDQLIYGSQGLQKTKVHHQITINQNFKISEIQDGNTQPPHSFQIISDIKSFIIYGKDESVKTQWFNDITKCVKDYRDAHGETGDSSSDAKPVWQTDSTSTTCTLCPNKFTMLFRRHHCRLCGILVCNDCSGERINKSRVCDICFAAKVEESAQEGSSSTSPQTPRPKNKSAIGSSMFSTMTRKSKNKGAPKLKVGKTPPKKRYSLTIKRDGGRGKTASPDSASTMVMTPSSSTTATLTPSSATMSAMSPISATGSPSGPSLPPRKSGSPPGSSPGRRQTASPAIKPPIPPPRPSVGKTGIPPPMPPPPRNSAPAALPVLGNLHSPKPPSTAKPPPVPPPPAVETDAPPELPARLPPSSPELPLELPADTDGKTPQVAPPTPKRPPKAHVQTLIRENSSKKLLEKLGNV